MPISQTPGFDPSARPDERRALVDLRRATARKMEWAGTWRAGLIYPPNSVVIDDGYTMICTNPQGCTTRPAPVPAGAPTYVYQGAAPTDQDTAKQIIFGNRYVDPDNGYYITGWRVWAVVGNFYSVYTLTPDGVLNVVQPEFEALNGGWIEFPLSPTLVPTGGDFSLICLVRPPDPTPTTFTADWNYITPNNEGAPATGGITHSNRRLDLFQISKTPTAGDASFLSAVSVGDTIEGAGLLWSVQAVVDQGTYFNFSVAPQQQGAPDGVATFAFTTTAAQPITYLRDVDHWAGSTLRGLYSPTGSLDDVVESDDAFGLDILVQAVDFSGEWEAVSLPPT